jgi:hypothetical protein
MLTNVQGLINELGTYQVSAEQRSSLAGKGPRMKALAGEIKVLFPSLSAEDKGLFLAAVARGRFEIEKGTIWPMFLDAVGIEAPAPTPKSTPAPAPQTNKVAGEILDHVKGHLVGLNLLDQAMGAQLNTMDRQVERLDSHQAILQSLVGMISDLQKQIAELKRPVTKRTLASV